MSVIKFCFPILFGIKTNNLFSQPVKYKDLIGNWHSINRKDAIKLNFIDSANLVLNWRGLLNHVKYTYNLDTSYQDRTMLSFLYMSLGVMRGADTFIWLINPNEIKIQGLENVYSQLPLIDSVDETKSIKLIRQRNKQMK
jgi:hypothetical protein